jgi:hypothetical protein
MEEPAEDVGNEQIAESRLIEPADEESLPRHRDHFIGLGERRDPIESGMVVEPPRTSVKVSWQARLGKIHPILAN